SLIGALLRRSSSTGTPPIPARATAGRSGTMAQDGTGVGLACTAITPTGSRWFIPITTTIITGRPIKAGQAAARKWQAPFAAPMHPQVPPGGARHVILRALLVRPNAPPMQQGV